MADLKENELPKQTNCEWVRALDANGNSIQINKKDLASVLGELLNISSLQNGFQCANFLLKQGESATVGKVGGLMVVRHPWSSSVPTVLLVNNYNRDIQQIAGRNYKEMPFTISWEGSQYNTVLIVTSTYANAEQTYFCFAYQNVYN